MIAPLTAILFVAILWLIAALAARTVKESGGKIVAALQGRSALASKSEWVAIRFERRPDPVFRTAPAFRAAA